MDVGWGVGVEFVYFVGIVEGLISRDMVGWGCFGRNFFYYELEYLRNFKIIWLYVFYNKIISKDVYIINYDWYFLF